MLSPNKWLEGVPGLAVVLVRRAALEAAAGRCHSFCLDLHRQWRSFEDSGRWRFTPPVQATAALVAALRQHAAEGQAARLERVRRNWRCLVEGLRALGFQTVLADEVAAPVIATFHRAGRPELRPGAPLRSAGAPRLRHVPRLLTPFPTFRIGCMGAFDETVMREVVQAVGAAMAEMGVRNCRPAPAAAE